MADDRTLPDDSFVLLICMSSMREALRISLQRLSALHGNKLGKWLDDYEQEVLQLIKNTTSTGKPLEIENAAVGHVIGLFGDLIADFRRALDEHNGTKPQ
jgi:hypothetical protein